MTRLEIKPYRKTLRQTAIILNVSVRTVRRYLDDGQLQWSGKQVLELSIKIMLGDLPPAPEKDPQEVKQNKSDDKALAARTFQPTRRSSFVHGWKR